MYLPSPFIADYTAAGSSGVSRFLLNKYLGWLINNVAIVFIFICSRNEKSQEIFENYVCLEKTI